jgi:hypothetical protein
MADYLKYTFLYEFTLGSNIWRYTSNAEDVIDVDGFVWEATSISDDGVNQTGDATSDQLTLTASKDIVPARLFMYSPPAAVMDLRIARAEFADKVPTLGFTGVDSTPDSRVIPVFNKRFRYTGEVSQCAFSNVGTAVFSVETISATMRRTGLRLLWMKQCPHTVYDPSTCKANKAANEVVATIDAINGLTLTVSAIAGAGNGFYNGGLLEFAHPIKGVEALAIEVQNGSSLIMFGSADGLYVGQQVSLYRGCDQTPAVCDSFGNYPNYGGVQTLPGKSPFDGTNSPVF